MKIKSLVFVAAVLTAAVMMSSCKKSEPSPAAAPQQNQEVSKPAGQPDAPQANAPAANVDASGQGLVAIDIKLPKPMFVGTPQNINIPNLEKPANTARPPFLAPAGTTNVALKKKVMSSFEQPISGDLEQIVDGVKEGTDGSYVELGPGLQNVTIDLGGEYNIHAVLVWHFHSTARVYKDIIAQVSNDPDFITEINTIYNNDHDNTAGMGVGQDKNYVETAEGKLIDAKAAKGRYVRLYSNGNNANDLNHYIEVEVYGTPVK
jgi:hypothetical protein